MSFDKGMYRVTYPSYQDRTFHRSRKFLYAPSRSVPTLLSTPLQKWNHCSDCFHHRLVLPVREHPINGIIERVLFYCQHYIFCSPSLMLYQQFVPLFLFIAKYFIISYSHLLTFIFIIIYYFNN